VKRRIFYFNRTSGVTTFEKPAVFKTAVEVAVEQARDGGGRGGGGGGHDDDDDQQLAQADIDSQLMQQAVADYSRAGPEHYTRIDENTRLPPSNKGYQMLLRLGWKKDTPLGVNGRGLLEPIVVDVHYNALGLGKKAEDEEHNAVAAKERKRLDIEITDLTPEERQQRDELKQRIEVGGGRGVAPLVCVCVCICGRSYSMHVCARACVWTTCLQVARVDGHWCMCSCTGRPRQQLLRT
jgi:hypothetical protein